MYKVVTDPRLLDELFHFRYGIAMEAFDGYQENPQQRDIDAYDDYAVHFIALDGNGNICAATRFIFNSPIGYPTENYLDFDLPAEIAENREKLAEISRIFIAKEARGIKSTKEIIKNFIELIYFYIEKHQIQYIYGALETSFLRLLHILKINYQVIGEGAPYYGFRYPCLLKTADLVKDNPRLLKKMELDKVEG
jgi:N-acyl-L-homoserine lactone synthetase